MKSSELELKSAKERKNETSSRKGTVTGFEQWGGYMAAKKEKLNAQYNAQKPQNAVGEVSQLFKGVAIFVNGYTRPPAEELKNLMLAHGGTYHYYYSPTHSTHIIATNLASSKIKNLKNERIVAPEWITDSIKACRLLPYHSYLLYTPENTNRQLRLNPKLVNPASTASVFSTMGNQPHTTAPEISSHDMIDKNETCIYSKQEYDSNDEQNSVKINVPSHSFTGRGNIQVNSTLQTPIEILDTSKSLNSACHVAKSPTKAGDPNFLSEFYSHSRLHHIATAGQELKQYVQQLVQMQKEKGFPGRRKLYSLKDNGFLTCGIFSSQDRVNAEKYDGDPSDQWLSKSVPNKIIMHIDVDCFFVSVGLKKYPELRGYPVVVTHSKGRKGAPQPGSDIEYEANYYNHVAQQKVHGPNATFENDKDDLRGPKDIKDLKDFGSLSEIACCSYEARRAGLHNGMFLGEALRLCPNLKTISYDFNGYKEVSRQLYDAVARYSLDIEAVSCDELYIDCSDLLQETGVSPLQFASVLREEIAEVTGCTASAGLGSNMLLARLATRVAKPNGQYLLSESEIEDFIKKQKVENLPGIGYSTSTKLEHFSILTCGDLQAWPLERLQKEFGPKSGRSLYEHCRGRDDKEVTLEKERKSVSAEINYGIRFQEDKDVFSFLDELAFEVHQRLKKIGKKGKSLTLKLKIRKDGAPRATAKFMGHGVCDSISKSVILKSPTDDPVIISSHCCQIVRDMKLNPEDYRGIGIQMTKLDLSDQVSSAKTIEHFLGSTARCSNKNFVDCATNELLNVGITTERKELLSSGRGKPFKTVKDFFSNSHNHIKPSDPGNELDESVLNALPEDIRNEVLLMYGRKEQNPKIKKAEPQKQNKNLTSKRGRKGKILKSSPKKPPLKINNIKLFPVATTSSVPITTLEVNAKQVKQPQRAHLCGSTSLESVRDLLKEWMQSSEAPREDDTDQFKDYLLAVIDEKDLEKVDLLLKYFFRLAQGSNILWQETYLTVLSYIQQKMLQEYGYMLKASCEF